MVENHKKVIEIEIQTYDKFLEFDLFNIAQGETLDVTKPLSLEGIGTVVIEPQIIFKSWTGQSTPEIIKFSLELLKDVSIGVVSAWLYDKLHRKDVEKIKINGEEINLEKEGINLSI
jgi:hypothetical protein